MSNTVYCLDHNVQEVIQRRSANVVTVVVSRSDIALSELQKGANKAEFFVVLDDDLIDHARRLCSGGVLFS